MVCGKEAQYSEIIATSANQIVLPKIPWRYENVVTRPPFPLGGLKGVWVRDYSCSCMDFSFFRRRCLCFD